MYWLLAIVKDRNDDEEVIFAHGSTLGVVPDFDGSWQVRGFRRRGARGRSAARSFSANDIFAIVAAARQDDDKNDGEDQCEESSAAAYQ